MSHGHEAPKKKESIADPLAKAKVWVKDKLDTLGGGVKAMFWTYALFLSQGIALPAYMVGATGAVASISYAAGKNKKH